MIDLQNDDLKFQLFIEGYYYPFSREYWDANWLSINVKLYNNEGLLYDKNDPCIRTIEIIDLKKWFKNIFDNDLEDSSKIEFMEPCISFFVNQNNLEMHLKYNLNPNYGKDMDSTYILSFVLDENILKKIILKLDHWIKKISRKKL